jgi:hypothetical protein
VANGRVSEGDLHARRRVLNSSARVVVEERGERSGCTLSSVPAARASDGITGNVGPLVAPLPLAHAHL